MILGNNFYIAKLKYLIVCPKNENYYIRLNNFEDTELLNLATFRFRTIADFLKYDTRNLSIEIRNKFPNAEFIKFCVYDVITGNYLLMVEICKFLETIYEEITIPYLLTEKFL